MPKKTAAAAISIDMEISHRRCGKPARLTTDFSLSMVRPVTQSHQPRATGFDDVAVSAPAPSLNPGPEMLDRLLKLLSAPESPPEGQDDLAIAVAVLLVEAARMDATFDQKERTTIERLLAERFALSAE